jgi:hypothetical protein
MPWLSDGVIGLSMFTALFVVYFIWMKLPGHEQVAIIPAAITGHILIFLVYVGVLGMFGCDLKVTEACSWFTVAAAYFLGFFIPIALYFSLGVAVGQFVRWRKRKEPQRWFTARRYCLGWSPCTWQGRLIIGIWLALLVYALSFVIVSKTLGVCLAVALTAFMLLVCWKTGEPLRWRRKKWP